MSVLQLSIETRIALRAADDEARAVALLGGSMREAIEQSHRVFNEILSLALKDDEARPCRS